MLVTALSQRLDSFNSDDIFSSFLTGHLIFSYIYIFFLPVGWPRDYCRSNDTGPPYNSE